MTGAALKIRVECLREETGETMPVRFYLGQRPIDVTAVLDRWLAPTRRYFKIKGNDGGIYILQHNGDNALWELTLFDSNRLSETKLSST